MCIIKTVHRCTCTCMGFFQHLPNNKGRVYILQRDEVGHRAFAHLVQCLYDVSQIDPRLSRR